MTITQLLSATILGLVMASATGCAYVETRYQDDTGKPAFEVGYRSGETYRLRAEGRIMSVYYNGRPLGEETRRLELWSPQKVARNLAYPDAGRLVAIVPAGTLVRVDGLEHNYGFAIPPVPGDSSILCAYGTIESGATRWVHVEIPSDHTAKWSFVPGTYVMAFPRDLEFLELVNPTSTGATTQKR